MTLSMNFSNLSVEGYTAFILALIFSMISIAGFIYFGKHKNTNKYLNVLLMIIFPLVTIFCWVYLILDTIGYGLVTTLCSSLACAVGYVLIALLIAFLTIHLSNKSKQPKKPKQVKEKPVKKAKAEEEEEDTDDIDEIAEIVSVDDETALDLEQEEETKPNQQTVVTPLLIVENKAEDTDDGSKK